MRKILFKLAILFIPVLLFVRCIDQVMPTSYATTDQIGDSESALEALSNSTAAFMYAFNYFGTLSSQEIGYPGMMIIRDALTDCPYVSTSYNKFSSYWCTLADFTGARTRQPWRYYYRMGLNANNTLSSISAMGNPDEVSENIQALYGNALVYRVLAYMDLMRMYEYKKTGVAILDVEAEKNKIYGLTSVIIDENFDPANASNNPRAPFYQMYRFIMTDLNKAEKYLANYNRGNKTKADLSVVHAYKARLWLEIATRFQKYPDDLQTQMAHENDEDLAIYDKLGITSATECYQKAAQYARNVIDKYTPLTKEEWHSVTEGFNKAKVDSWVFAITITSPDAVYSRVDNFLSNCVTEYSRGYSRSQYHCYRMIDKNLYDQIEDSDWRKVTWIDPADAGKKPTPEKYYTQLGELDKLNKKEVGTEWALRDAYVGFKFRPNQGDISEDYTKALQVDFPIIRVEEMYFIEAEAKAYTESMASGIAALTSFINTYRYTDGSYSISPTDVEDLVDNYIITQKRIELWGEGLAYFDIKRRELPITRGYTGSNWLAANRYNSHPGYTASWMNLYIPYESEGALNKAMLLNPDPSVVDSYGLWTGK